MNHPSVKMKVGAASPTPELSDADATLRLPAADRTLTDLTAVHPDIEDEVEEADIVESYPVPAGGSGVYRRSS
jgi:hypothetical protein